LPPWGNGRRWAIQLRRNPQRLRVKKLLTVQQILNEAHVQKK